MPTVPSEQGAVGIISHGVMPLAVVWTAGGMPSPA